MAQAFLAVLLALSLSHLLTKPQRYRRFEWVLALEGALRARLGAAGQAGLGLALALTLLLLAVFALSYALHFEVLQFLLGAAVLWLSLGPRELTQDIDQVIDARSEESRALAASRLSGMDPAPADLVSAAAVQALRRWFAPILWFLVLGPLGALGYRLLALFRESDHPASRRAALALLHLAELPPAYLLVLALALASHLDAVFNAARESAQRNGWADPSLGYLGDAMHSVADSAEAASDGFNDELGASSPALARTINLLQRSLFVWMTAIALIVLVRVL